MPLPIPNRCKAGALAAVWLACQACSSALAQDDRVQATARNEDKSLRVVDPISARLLFTQTPRPVASRPMPTPAERRKGGIGGIAAEPGLVWKLGPQVVRPTAAYDPLGAGTWTAGVASVALAVEGVRLYGALASERCALAGDVDRGIANGVIVQPFVNYNLLDGWYLTSVPVINADWSASRGQRWTVPIGAAIGRFARLGEMPLSVHAGYYYNIERPDGGPDWTLSFQLRLLFPG
ncbi:MAG TPA: hypothetical protein VLD36_24020 [Burkholderiales bacterium]|nr:hypothetical protein [Burkholderiales bacterium]